MMTEIEAIRERRASIGTGDWQRDDNALGGTERTICCGEGIVVQTCTNANSNNMVGQLAVQCRDLDFIAHAPSDIDTLLAALDFVTQQFAWQPIATAPKDGTMLDLWCESTRQCEEHEQFCERTLRVRFADMSWVVLECQRGEWVRMGDDGNFILLSESMGNPNATPWNPTHWKLVERGPEKGGE